MEEKGYSKRGRGNGVENKSWFWLTITDEHAGGRKGKGVLREWRGLQFKRVDQGVEEGNTRSLADAGFIGISSKTINKFH